MADVVPFGKYRGQPIEALAADAAYTDWLTAQPWFRDRYANLYTVIINNFAPPADTPEHNALQARFLDGEFCLKIAEAAFPHWVRAAAHDRINSYHRTSYHDAHDKEAFAAAEAYLANSARPELSQGVRFETAGLDVQLEIGGVFAHIQLRIEIKPSLGDDFPTVLRQMKRSNANVLLCGEYVGSGIDQATLIALFKNERIRAVFLTDIQE